MSEDEIPPSQDEAAAHKARMEALRQEQAEKVRSKTQDRGIVIVNTGDGKGKSTAAFGLAIRAAGSGQNVGLVQFIKGTWKTGEAEALKRFPEVRHVVSGEGFTWNTQDKTADIAAARRGWDIALEMIEQSRGPEPKYSLVILDELNIVLSYGYLPVEEVVRTVLDKPTELSICITGRGAPEALVDAIPPRVASAPGSTGKYRPVCLSR